MSGSPPGWQPPHAHLPNSTTPSRLPAPAPACRFPSTTAFALQNLNPYLSLAAGKVSGAVDCSGTNLGRKQYDVCWNEVSLFSGG